MMRHLAEQFSASLSYDKVERHDLKNRSQLRSVLKTRREQPPFDDVFRSTGRKRWSLHAEVPKGAFGGLRARSHDAAGVVTLTWFNDVWWGMEVHSGDCCVRDSAVIVVHVVDMLQAASLVHPPTALPVLRRLHGVRVGDEYFSGFLDVADSPSPTSGDTESLTQSRSVSGTAPADLNFIRAAQATVAEFLADINQQGMALYGNKDVRARRTSGLAIACGPLRRTLTHSVAIQRYRCLLGTHRDCNAAVSIHYFADESHAVRTALIRIPYCSSHNHDERTYDSVRHGKPPPPLLRQAEALLRQELPWKLFRSRFVTAQKEYSARMLATHNLFVSPRDLRVHMPQTRMRTMYHASKGTGRAVTAASEQDAIGTDLETLSSHGYVVFRPHCDGETEATVFRAVDGKVSQVSTWHEVPCHCHVFPNL